MSYGLAIVERAYRGTVETQFADVLYLVRELNRQLGGLDVVLRGLAATYAVETEPVPALRIADTDLDEVPDQRKSIRQLLEEGVAVWVEESDLAALDPNAISRLLPGVRRAGVDEPSLRWSEYQAVWFL